MEGKYQNLDGQQSELMNTREGKSRLTLPRPALNFREQNKSPMAAEREEDKVRSPPKN